MQGITTRQYRILSDHAEIYRFMTEIFAPDWRNGAAAPFHEYALASSWMDKRFSHRYRIWLCGERVLGYCFTEDPATDVYFSLRPGYEPLADEMIEYAARCMPNIEGKQRFVLFAGQEALMAAAAKAGFQQRGSSTEYGFFFDRPFQHALPEGFRFVEPGGLALAKIAECCWKGFDHEAEEGAWDGDTDHHAALMQAPHATPQHALAIADGAGDYACFAGMWWTPENRLAYMEPLCTVPAHRGKGLAAAALSELARRMQSCGAAYMTGGSNPFYQRIGFVPMIEWTYWSRNA